MDQNLRITVGNERFFDGSRPRSPRDDPRSRLGPRLDGAPRYDERIDGPYRRPSGPPAPPHPSFNDDRRSWGQDSNWPPRRHSPERHPDHYLPPRQERPKYDEGRGYYPDGRRWSPEKTLYEAEMRRKYERRSRSHSPPRERSPYQKRGSSPYSAYAKIRRRSGSRSPPRNTGYSPSTHHRTEELLGSVYKSSNELGLSRSDSRATGALDSLRESYEFVKGDGLRRSYHDKQSKTLAADDEEAFLYGGDDAAASRYLKEAKKREQYPAPSKAPEPAPPKSKPSKKEAVTPGGFDTHALKNVLKAIGFDFELSAQSLQKAAVGKDSSKDNSEPVPPQARAAAAKQSLHSSQPQPTASALPSAPELAKPNPFQMPLQPGQYVPQSVIAGQDSNLFFNQATLQTYSANLGTSTSVAQRFLYQPRLAQTSLVPVMHTSDNLPLTVPDRPNLKVVPTISMEEKEKKAKLKSAKLLEQEKKVRKKRLDYLEHELKNLKKKQAELIRKKKKQLDSSDREQIVENTIMQEGVVKQIREIREAAERAAGIRSDETSESESEESSSSGSSSSDDDSEPSYFDRRNHVCRDCNLGKFALRDFLNHLHTKGHKKTVDPAYKPWYKPIKFKTKPSSVQIPLKGVHFMLPILGFYCKLCKTYCGDAIAAQEHLKAKFHNQKFNKFCKKNPDYEKQEKSDIEIVIARLGLLKQEQQKKDKERTEYLRKQGIIPPKSVKSEQKKEKAKAKPKNQPPKDDARFVNDRKPQYMKPKQSPETTREQEFGPEPPSKSNQSQEHHAEDSLSVGSRSSSKMSDRTPTHYKDPKPKGYKDSKEYKDSREYMDPREYKDPKGYKDPREHNDPREYKDPKGYKDPRDYKDPREHKDPKGYKDPREHNDPREYKDPKGYKDPRDYKDPREYKDPKGYKDPRDYKDPREYKDPKAHQDPKEYKDPKGYRSHFQPDSRSMKSPGGHSSSQKRRSYSPGGRLHSDDDRSQKSSAGYSSSRKRSHSPVGRMYSDRMDSLDQYKYPEKRRYEDSRKVMKDDKRGNMSRKNQWSPGYDEMEERREDNEQREKIEQKKAKSPDKTFGKFTWKKLDKGKSKKNAAQDAESTNEKADENKKFSLKIETKTSNTVSRQVNRAGFGTFAPHTKVMTSHKEEFDASQLKIKSQSGKKLVQPVPPPDVARRIPVIDRSAPKSKKTYEPPPPGTEGVEDIFQGSDDEDAASDASGISMEMGSDGENF